MSPYRMTPPAPWPGLFDGLPAAFRPYLTEPAFSDGHGTLLATVCFWREQADTEWRRGAAGPLPPGAADDGADLLSGVLADGRPETCQRFAEDYYEAGISIGAVHHVDALHPLTQSIVSALNPEASVPALRGELRRIGYP